MNVKVHRKECWSHYNTRAFKIFELSLSRISYIQNRISISTVQQQNIAKKKKREESRRGGRTYIRCFGDADHRQFIGCVYSASKQYTNTFDLSKLVFTGGSTLVPLLSENETRSLETLYVFLNPASYLFYVNLPFCKYDLLNNHID